MLWVLQMIIPKQELVMQLTSKAIVTLVTPELGLVPEEILITPLRVEMLQPIPQIMVTDTSKLWDIFWCSKLFQSMYYVRKLAKNGEVGHLKEPFSILSSPPTSPLKRQSENLLTRLQITRRLVRLLNSFSSDMPRVRRREETLIRTSPTWVPFVEPFEPKVLRKFS